MSEAIDFSNGVVVLDLKQCRKCGEVKRLDDFHRRYDCDSWQSECKRCKNGRRNDAKRRERASMRTPQKRGHWERADEMEKGREVQTMLFAWAAVRSASDDKSPEVHQK